MKYHPLFILAVPTFILSILTMIVVGIWLFLPDDVMVIKNHDTVPTDKVVYHAGDRIAYTLDSCKSRYITGRITRTLVDGFRINYTQIDSQVSPGCHKTTFNDLTIPNFIPSGTYHLEGSGTYQINPLRTFVTHWRTNDFEVINKEDKEAL